MNKFSHEEGLTLIELLITLAVIAIVFAIAVPVFSNVLAGAQTSADAAQAAALASFNEEYATTTLVYANGVTTATLNGVQIASIKGDATGTVTAPVEGYVFNTAGYAFSDNASASSTWSAATPVLWTNPGASIYHYETLANAQGVAQPWWTTMLSDNTASLYGGMMEYRYLSAAPTAGTGAQILPLV